MITPEDRENAIGLFRAGIIDRDEARKMVGLGPEPGPYYAAMPHETIEMSTVIEIDPAEIVSRLGSEEVALDHLIAIIDRRRVSRES